MHASPAKAGAPAFRVLSYALVLYAALCQVSQSATYFPHAALSLAAAYIWFQSDGAGHFPSRLKPLLAVLVLLVAWRFTSRIVNDRAFVLAPLESALYFLPIFLLCDLPYEENAKMRTAQNAIWTLLAVSVLFILLGILQKISGLTYPLPRQFFRDGRFYGLFDYYIHAGSFFGAVAIFTLGLFVFWDTTLKRKTLLGICGMILVAGTLLSYSRAYYIAVLVAAILMLFKKSLRSAALGGLLVLVMAAAVLVFSPSVRDRAFSIADLEGNSSNQERLHLMNVAITIIREHPAAGVGYKEWSRSLGEYTSKYTGWTFSDAVFSHAHNMYLTVAAETGIPGLALFVLFWMLLLFLLLRPRGEPGSFRQAVSLGAGFALVCMLIGAFFDDNLQKLLDIFLLVFLIALSFFVSSPEKALQNR